MDLTEAEEVDKQNKEGNVDLSAARHSGEASDCEELERNDNLEDDPDYIWLPASLASHMGVVRRQSMVSGYAEEERVYADDEDLFMTVETSRSTSKVSLEKYQEHQDCHDEKSETKTFTVVLHHNVDWLTHVR